MNKYNMRTNFIWIQISCVALSLLSMLTGMPAPAEADGPLPVINYFTADPTFITSGEYTYLSWDVSGGEDTIVFLSAYGSDIYRDAAHLAKVNLKPSQTITYTLRATNDYGEGVTVTRSVTVFVDEGQPSPSAANQPPVASFSVTPANPTTGDTLLSNNTSTDPDGDALTYKWYIGGKLVADSMNWQYPNPPAGSYNIELSVDDGKGGTDTRTETIFVSNAAAQGANQPPVASFSLTQDTSSPNVYEGNSTSWDPDGDVLKCSWYFNGEYKRSVGDSSYWKIEFEPGVWNIKLVVDDGKGGTDTYAKTITVMSLEILSHYIRNQSGKVSPFLDNDNIIFNGYFGGRVPPCNYFWDFGDGTDTGWLKLDDDEIQSSHQYSCPGTYHVRLVARDSAGNEVYDENDIVIVSTFMKTESPNSERLDDIHPTISCEPVEGKCPDNFGHYYVKFTCSDVTGGFPPYSYHWDFGDRGERGTAWSGQENTMIHDYWELGQYTVAVMVFDSCNSEARSSIQYDFAEVQEKIEVLVVTSSSRLITKFGAGGWAQLEDRLKQLGWTILDIGSAPVNAIDHQIEAKGADNIPKILILGGHDVVPFAILPNPAQDDDTLYTDDVYADFDHDPQAIVDIPIARIPDGGDLNLLLTQLSSSYSLGLGNFVLANYMWEAAEAIANIFDASVIWSRPAKYNDLDPAKIMAKYSYYSLHGSSDQSYFWMGEDWQGDDHYPVAFVVWQANSKGIVHSDCCYGAYVIDRSPADSICLRFLRNGARCFIGPTGISYAVIDGSEPNAEGDLFDKIFFTKLMEGKTPLQAFHGTKVEYAARAVSSSERKIAHQFVYYGRP